jgi:hypothetical protein
MLQATSLVGSTIIKALDVTPRYVLMSNVYYCETVSEQRAARCIVAPGDPDQRRWEAHPGTPAPPVPRVEKHETPERD